MSRRKREKRERRRAELPAPTEEEVTQLRFQTIVNDMRLRACPDILWGSRLPFLLGYLTVEGAFRR